jgi:putative endonuclease
MTEHRQGVGSFFTKKYNIKILLYFETYASIKDAISREKQLKAGSRAKKEALINSENAEWRDLCEGWK